MTVNPAGTGENGFLVLISVRFLQGVCYGKKTNKAQMEDYLLGGNRGGDCRFF